MTTRTPSPIEILADSALRDAAEAGAAVIALDEGLNVVLFADGVGRSIVDTSGPSPVLRQVRSAARRLVSTGRATVLLRRSTIAGSRLVEAELTLRPGDGTPFALMTIAGLGRPIEDVDLIEAAGLGTEAAAVFAEGAERDATPGFADHPLPDLQARLSRFEAGAESVATSDDGAVKLTFVRVPFGRIVAVAQASERPPAEEPVKPVSEALPSPPVPANAPAGFAAFSVKRAKIGAPRPGMSMSALLQRWHSRGPETEPSGTTENDGMAVVAVGDDALPAAIEHTEAVTGTDTPARATQLRSNWGGSETMTDEAGPVEPVQLSTDREAETALSAAEAVGEADDNEAAILLAAEGLGNEIPVEDEPAEGFGEAAGVDTQSLEEIAVADGSSDEAHASESDADESAQQTTEVSETDAETILDTTGSDRADQAAEAVVEAGARVQAATAEPEPAAQTVGTRAKPAFVPRFDMPPVRFVWQIDRDGAFRFLSPDFAVAVGPNAADVVGRGFSTVARVFGFDETREIARLLERRDTWSGRTIFWPVQGSDRKVPVDLAALPVYGRDRSFDGFRGFGIVRLNESVMDEEGLGLLLTNGQPPARAEAPDAATSMDGEAVPEAVTPREKPFLRRFEAESFGRRAEPPATPESEAETDETQKVIRLEERRRPREGVLSSSEEAAFRAIGAKLGIHTEAESPGALRFEEPASPAAAPARENGATDEEKPLDTPTGSTKTEPRDGPPEALQGATKPDGTLVPVAETRPIAEPDGIEPALAALSEKLAQAEAEADRRLAARKQSGKTMPATGPASEASPAAPDLAEPAHPESGAFDSAIPSDTDAPSQPLAQSEPSDAPSTSAGDLLDRIAPETAETTQPSAARPDEDALDDVVETPVLPAYSQGPRDAGSGTADVAEAPFETNPVEAEDDEEPEEPPLDLTVFERLFAGLPLAVLVQVRESTVYANAEFGLLTGHADAAAVEAAGGLDALVLDRQGEGTLALLRADGEVVEVNAHMQRIAESGRSALLMSFSRVVDEAAAAGPALDDLRQEVEELQAVLDTATDGVVLLDMAGHIRAMNGSGHALFGLGADEAFGRHLSSLVAPESQKATADYLEMLRDDGIGGILNDGREVIGRVSQGGFIPLFITIGRLTGERGWCVVIRDIAHWKRIEEDLVNARRQAEAASLHKSRFLANISHELRTPLNAIIGFADVMSSECFGPIGNERYLEYLGDIKRSGHHVLDLVNDLLDISKIEAGKIELTFEAVSLNEVISEAVSLMQPQANRERVIVRSNLPSSVPPVVADRRSVRQIALNLLTNAIKFTPAGGQIIASTTYSAEGEVLLRFRDSGIGMTEREIELALTPFQQVHAPSANRGEGTGLGLPLTKAMVEANRASFSIQSTPGEGTLVEIVFPAPRVLAD